MDTTPRRLLGLLALAPFLVFSLAACDDDGDGGGGGGGGGGRDETYACDVDEDFCLEYTGPSRNIATIRDATDCEGNGGAEVSSCSNAGASICSLPENSSSGVRSRQVYYGFDDEDADAHQAICESSGGTYSRQP